MPPAKSVIIEKATLRDIDGILKIENRSFPQPFSRNMFETELLLEIAHLYVLRERARIAGYIDFWHVGPEIHLISIAVHPRTRRRGHGRRLMDFLFQSARMLKAVEIFLDVRLSNKGAIQLYREYGFKKVGVRKEYYRDNREDALVMRCDLSHETFRSNIRHPS